MLLSDWVPFHTFILELEQRGLVTRTFRRLDPDRQQAVLEAILTEAYQKGLSHTSIKEVARLAKVSVGALYTYFPNRGAMLAFATELCVRITTGIFSASKDELAAMPLNAALQAYLQTGIEWSQTMVWLVGLFARAAYQGDPELNESIVQPIACSMLDLIRTLLQQAQQRGELRQDIDLEAMARIVHALTVVVGDSQLIPYLNAYFQVTGPEVSFERSLAAMLDLVQHGISIQP
jgi:AcrR family transcriptional regulator